jgi:hypothetical protein
VSLAVTDKNLAEIARTLAQMTASTRIRRLSQLLPSRCFNDFALRQIGQLAGQAIIQTIREAVFDSDIAGFGIANVTKATTDCN